MSLDSWTGSIQQPGTLHKYAYVLNSPINLADPSGKYPPLPEPPSSDYYGPSVQPAYDVCRTWPKSGYLRDLCNRAYHNVDLDAMEKIYRYIAIAESPAMPESARALNYFLNGKKTPGRPRYFSRWWYLDSPVTKKARDDLKQQIIDHIDSLKNSSDCSVLSRAPVHKVVKDINIDSGLFNIPDDRQTVLGSHNLNVDAYLNLNSNFRGWIKYEFYVYEWFDFRKGSGNIFTIPQLGWEVPTAWADFLVDGGKAAEYWTVVRWTDRDWYWK